MYNFFLVVLGVADMCRHLLLSFYIFHTKPQGSQGRKSVHKKNYSFEKIWLYSCGEFRISETQHNLPLNFGSNEHSKKRGLTKIYLYSKASASAMKLLASLILRGRVPLTTVQAIQPNTESIAEAVDDAWR